MEARPRPEERIPKNYRVLLDILEAAGHGVHFTTAELFEAARGHRPGIGFTTVYRGLQRLRDLALVDEIQVPGAGAAVYELSSEPHAHFRCDRCGAVADVAFELPAASISALERSAGASISGARLTLHGTCRACSV